MDEMNEWMWLVNTAKGDFFITVTGRWTQEEAAKKVRTIFDTLKLDIVGMIPRKRATGPIDMTGSIIQQLKPKDELGFDFYAGEKFWRLCGRGAEYDVQRILLEEEMKKGSV